jgi:HK97 gp10 family phage protein
MVKSEGRLAVKVSHEPTDPRDLVEIANSDEVQAECRKLARDIRKDARRLAPKKTGNLSRHIEVEAITDLATGIEGFAVGWGDKAWYGQMVEDGTEDTPPAPHLAPAAIKHGATVGGGERP